MAENLGKKFEDCVRNSFERVPDTKVVRLIDPQNGFAGIRNMCDFIVYHYPVMFLIECKCCHGNTMSIHSNDPTKKYGMITNNQWEELYAASYVSGIFAGYMIWFVDHDRTVFVPSPSMQILKDNGNKSLNILHIAKQLGNGYMNIDGTKKRKFFDYDMRKFIKEVTECLSLSWAMWT